MKNEQPFRKRGRWGCLWLKLQQRAVKFAISGQDWLWTLLMFIFEYFWLVPCSQTYLPHKMDKHAGKGRFGMPCLGLNLNSSGKPSILQFSGHSRPWILQSILDVLLNHHLQVIRDTWFNFCCGHVVGTFENRQAIFGHLHGAKSMYS